MTVRFITLGCKVNQYESEAMLETLLRNGFTQAGEGEPADVVVVNSCTVTAAGDQKARQALRRARRENPAAVTALTGCWPQAFPEAAAAFQEADIVFGTANRSALLGHILAFLEQRERIVDIAPHGKGEAFEPMAVTGLRGRTRAFLKIEDGCEQFCTYCVIPAARGRVRSKPLADLAAEAQALAANGYAELVLAGINLSAYGRDLGLDLADGVNAAAGPKGVRRVRLSSLEPELLDGGLIRRLAAQPKLCPHFHLALQSGSDRVLGRMGRRYDTQAYRRIAAALRGAFPGCSLTTDLMVGFPGETGEDFQRSLDFVEEMGFARVHVFAYSKRPGTPAARWPDQVPNAVKEERSRQARALAARLQLQAYRERVGKTELVLFERRGAQGAYEGYTGTYLPVRVPDGEGLAGRLLPVRITGADEAGCIGEIAKN